jgi:hypothetical protein
VREAGGPGGSVLRIYFLSDMRDKGISKGSSCAFCAKRSEHEQGREMVYKKVQVLTKILKNRAF